MAIGSIIYFNDLSTMRDTMNNILNLNTIHNETTSAGGYNQAHTVAANPASGDLIDDAYQDSLFSAAAKIANYYNITNPFTAVNAGTTIAWSDYAQYAATFNSDITARHNAPWTYSAGWDTTTATELTSSVTDWNGSKTFDFNLGFATAAHMNSWFSAGGEVRISFAHSTASSDLQAQSWVQLASEVGTYRISARPTDSTNTDLSTRFKYSDLTAAYVTLKQENADHGYYTMNYIQIQAYKTATNVYVRCNMNDAHVADTGTWSNDGGGSWTGTDVVTGTTTCTVQSLKLSNPAGSVNITNPTFTTTSNF